MLTAVRWLEQPTKRRALWMGLGVGVGGGGGAVIGSGAPAITGAGMVTVDGAGATDPVNVRVPKLARTPVSVPSGP